MTEPKLSILTTVIDDVEKISFDLVLDNAVIASAAISFPNEPLPVLMSGFVSEAFRGKGYWKWLYSARLSWIQCSNPTAEHVHLYVDESNPMAAVYERMGFEYTGETNTDNGCKWMRLKLD